MSSFRKKGPGVLASGLIGAATGFAVVGGPIALLSYAAASGKDKDPTRHAPAQQPFIRAANISSAHP